MKKSLLSLALATLATTAFANSVLFESNSKELTLSVDGSAAYDFSHTVKATKAKNITTGTYNKNSYEGEVEGAYDLKLASTFTYENPETFKFGFTGELGSKNSTIHTRENGYLNNIRVKRTEANYEKTKEPWTVKATKAEIFASHKAFGALVFGKTNTLVDQFVSASLNTLEVSDRFFNTPTDSKLAVVYNLPSFVEDLTLQYGYAGEQGQKGFRQNSLKATYSKFGADFALGAIYTTKYGAESFFSKFKDQQASSYELSIKYNEVPYLKDLTVTALYNFSKGNNYTLSNVTKKLFKQTALIDFKYEALNGLVTPYTGIELSKERSKDSNSFNKDRTLETYLGIQSTYKPYLDISATAYLEAKYSKTNTVIDTTNRSESKTHSKAFAAGVKVSF